MADWVEQGHWLGAVGRASGWWLGDWIRYGNGRYGDKYAPAAQATGYDVQSLMNMAYVAGRFEISRRRESLSFSHHSALAGLPSEDQELWLDRIEASQLSVRALRAELRNARRSIAARLARGNTRAGAADLPDADVDHARLLGVQSVDPPALDDSTLQQASPVCPHCGRPLPRSALTTEQRGASDPSRGPLPDGHSNGSARA